MHWFLTFIITTMQAPPDTVVVCPQDLRAALQPWVQRRMAQGHRLAYVNRRHSSDAIREEIKAIHKLGGVKYVVVVGDAPSLRGRRRRRGDGGAPIEVSLNQNTEPATSPSVSTHYQAAQVNRLWGSEPEIATDNFYGDFDGDQIPEAAVGRFPVDSPEELRSLVQKITAYESSLNRGLWRRKLHFVAGTGGFGRVVDAVLEHAVKRFVAEGVPPGYAASMTYANWRSPYCPDPRRFRQTAIERLNDGCLFWIYMGHGQRTYLDRVRTPAGAFPVLSIHDMDQVASRAGAPIALLFSCYAAAFDGPQDCLGEELLKRPKGPVAVLGGSRVTMPYAMSVLAYSMMGEFFEKRRATLGDVILNAKRRMAAKGEAEQTSTPNALPSRSPPRGSPLTLDRRFLDIIAAAISPAAEQLAAERKEHLALFNLLGDPLLRLPYPKSASVVAAPKCRAGETLPITAHAPFGGRLTVELVCRRDAVKSYIAPRKKFHLAHDQLEAYQSTYLAANDQVWTRRELAVENQANGGEKTFFIELPIPSQARGSCFVRVFIEGENDCALGAAQVFVER